jgi:protein Tex
VHQDGLVHVSQLANKFVTDAREVVKTGDIVKVRVLEVDLARKRVSLTMKLDAKPALGPTSAQQRESRGASPRHQGASADPRRAADGGSPPSQQRRPSHRAEPQHSGGGGRGEQPLSAMAAAFARLKGA